MNKQQYVWVVYNNMTGSNTYFSNKPDKDVLKEMFEEECGIPEEGDDPYTPNYFEVTKEILNP